MSTRRFPFPPLLASLVVVVGLAGCERSPSAAGGIDTGPGAAELAQGKRAHGAGDPVRALELFLEAAEEGNAEAQYHAGLMLAEGQGVSQRDVRTAARLFARAAAKGQPDAAVELARLPVFGLVVERDVPRAIELFDQAARAYPPGAQRDHAAEQRDALRAVLRGEPVPGVPVED